MFFFHAYKEYHKDPSTIGARHFSRLAMWKFREFNELDHFFHLRLSRCYPAANAYMSQFRKEDVVIIAKFASFIAGSFAAVLALLSLVDQAFVMNFEITPGGSVLFYIGLFGGIYAATRSMVRKRTTSDAVF